MHRYRRALTIPAARRAGVGRRSSSPASLLSLDLTPPTQAAADIDGPTMIGIDVALARMAV
jgi:hypothetical protein